MRVSRGCTDRRKKLPDEVAPETGEPEATLRRVPLTISIVDSGSWIQNEGSILFTITGRQQIFAF
jgi:hypothetical protein